MLFWTLERVWESLHFWFYLVHPSSNFVSSDIRGHPLTLTWFPYPKASWTTPLIFIQYLSKGQSISHLLKICKKINKIIKMLDPLPARICPSTCVVPFSAGSTAVTSEITSSILQYYSFISNVYQMYVYYETCIPEYLCIQ